MESLALQEIRARARAHQAELDAKKPKPKFRRVSQYFRPAEAAAYLNVSEEELYALTPPSISPGARSPRWAKEDLDALESESGECRVYVIRRRDTAEIKIGISTNPLRRLADLQTAHGAPLELAALFLGDVEEEMRLHERFKSCRKLGEWFSETPELLAWIEALT